ncbi:MAG: biotin transporter BioY [Anaerolineae bacterium]|nr:biotin transporter BioY [Anaerolineae bacterium]
MLRTLSQMQDAKLPARLVGIGVFTLVTVVAARISIPMDPVPFTFQPLAALLAGMILGARDGALSQLIYVGLIAIGLPLDANMRGQAALFGPTGGYLIGFIAAAFVSGWLVEHGANRTWQRWLAGVAGIAVLYVLGVSWLAVSRGLPLDAAISAGALPFLLPDLAKALIAAALAEGGRALMMRGNE